jgi:hypothetical protein
MLRWLVLLVLLGNALLFLWYAQEYRFTDTLRQSDIRPAAIRLPDELGEGESLLMRPRECGYFQPLETDYEAERLLAQLEEYDVDLAYEKIPPIALGWRVELPLPADADRRVALLDQLASLGWVPESRDGALVMGVYPDDAAVNELYLQFPDDLRNKLRKKTNYIQSDAFRVAVSYLQGFEFDQELIKSVATQWPGAQFEKKPCEGVATLKSDQ